MFTLTCAGVALEALTSHDKFKLGAKSLQVYQIQVSPEESRAATNE